MSRLIDKLGFTSRLILTGAIVVACSGQSSPTNAEKEEEYNTAQSADLSSATACTEDANCPSTAFCDNLTYGPWRCRTKRATGSYCGDTRECKSGICTNYVCACSPPPPPPPPPAPACRATGKRCVADSDCCAGFCNSDNGYGYGGYGYGYGYGFSYCSAPQPNGSSCMANNQCASGVCDQYECKPAVCTTVAKGCSSNADCCANLFCDTDTYAPPTCIAKRATGAYCQVGSECQTGSCVSYICH